MHSDVRPRAALPAYLFHSAVIVTWTLKKVRVAELIIIISIIGIIIIIIIIIGIIIIIIVALADDVDRIPFDQRAAVPGV